MSDRLTALGTQRIFTNKGTYLSGEGYIFNNNRNFIVTDTEPDNPYAYRSVDNVGNELALGTDLSDVIKNTLPILSAPMVVAELMCLCGVCTQAQVTACRVCGITAPACRTTYRGKCTDCA